MVVSEAGLGVLLVGWLLSAMAVPSSVSAHEAKDRESRSGHLHHGRSCRDLGPGRSRSRPVSSADDPESFEVRVSRPILDARVPLSGGGKSIPIVCLRFRSMNSTKTREVVDGTARWRNWPGWIDAVGRYPLLPLTYIFIKYRLGMASIIRAHDNLDHFAAVYDRMSPSDLFAAPGATLDFVLGGLPRDVVGSELFVGTLTGAVLPLVWAMVVSELITRCVAFYGMRRLLRVTNLASERVVTVGIPTLFALLPFHHPVVASVAGVPLLLSALISLHRRRSRANFMILAVFPAISWAGATLPYVAVVVAYASVGRIWGRVPPVVLKAAAVFAGAFVVIEWRLVYSVLVGPASHRADMASGVGGGALDLAALSGRVFALGRNLFELLEKHADHASMALVPVSIVLVGVAIVSTLVSRKDPDPSARVLIITLVGISAVLIGARVWPYLDTHVLSRLVDLPHFQMDRIAWVVPALGYLALAAGADSLLRIAPGRLTAVAVVVVFISQGVAIWHLGDFNTNDRAQVSIEEFYSPEVFADVAEIVNAAGGDGRVVSVGFHPHVAVYNGFDAADGYWYNYPLEYKRRFRTLIAPALDADSGLAAYFDGWGSRAYVFQPALGNPDCCVVADSTPYEALIDSRALGNLGIGYVLSNGEISNASGLGLGFLGIASAPDSPYRIHVYAVQF